jgi:hypothetical protein
MARVHSFNPLRFLDSHFVTTCIRTYIRSHNSRTVTVHSFSSPFFFLSSHQSVSILSFFPPILNRYQSDGSIFLNSDTDFHNVNTEMERYRGQFEQSAPSIHSRFFKINFLSNTESDMKTERQDSKCVKMSRNFKRKKKNYDSKMWRSLIKHALQNSFLKAVKHEPKKHTHTTPKSIDHKVWQSFLLQYKKHIVPSAFFTHNSFHTDNTCNS